MTARMTLKCQENKKARRNYRKCECGGRLTVIETRYNEQDKAVRRRYKCLRCVRRFTSYEIVAPELPEGRTITTAREAFENAAQLNHDTITRKAISEAIAAIEVLKRAPCMAGYDGNGKAPG